MKSRGALIFAILGPRRPAGAVCRPCGEHLRDREGLAGGAPRLDRWRPPGPPVQRLLLSVRSSHPAIDEANHPRLLNHRPSQSRARRLDRPRTWRPCLSTVEQRQVGGAESVSRHRWRPGRHHGQTLVRPHGERHAVSQGAAS
jgi:hypothetical protein